MIRRIIAHLVTRLIGPTPRKSAGPAFRGPITQFARKPLFVGHQPISMNCVVHWGNAGAFSFCGVVPLRRVTQTERSARPKRISSQFLLSYTKHRWEKSQSGPSMLIWLGKQRLGQKERYEHGGPDGKPIPVSFQLLYRNKDDHVRGRRCTISVI